jgi:hypothetical protein
MKHSVFVIALGLALSVATLVAPAARAADLPAPAPTRAAPAAAAPAADRLAKARELIAAKQWAPALEELRRVNDTASADWNNLMGFTLRKGPAPDLASSEHYYDQALRIDPHHLNTLEYSGELYLMKGELARAQARLEALAGACGGRCAQYAALNDAIERYKAAGNKFVSTGW